MPCGKLSWLCHLAASTSQLLLISFLQSPPKQLGHVSGLRLPSRPVCVRFRGGAGTQKPPCTVELRGLFYLWGSQELPAEAVSGPDHGASRAGLGWVGSDQDRHCGSTVEARRRDWP